MYKVEVEVRHPRTNSNDEIIKMFYLNVTANRKIFRLTTIVTVTVNSSKVESDIEQRSSKIESDIEHCSSTAVLQAACNVDSIYSKHTIAV